MTRKDLTDYLIKVEEITKIGLKYSKDPYAIDNYTQLEKLTFDFINDKLDIKMNRPNFFERNIYPTPSVSVRTVILSKDRKKVLLVKERSDNGYSLPGGWSELTLSPSESALKEVKEEAGIEAKIVRLVGVLDRYSNIPTTSTPEYIVVFEAEVISEKDDLCYEIISKDYFPIDNLPTWSIKNRPEQMQKILDAVINNKTIFE